MMEQKNKQEIGTKMEVIQEPDEVKVALWEQEKRFRAEQEQGVRALTDKLAAMEQTLMRERAEAMAALALTRAGARNMKAARAMLTVDPAGVSGQEQAESFAAGLEQQVALLKNGADTAFLFASERPVFRGFVPAEGRDGAPQQVEPSSLAEAVRMAISPDVNMG